MTAGRFLFRHSHAGIQLNNKALPPGNLFLSYTIWKLQSSLSGYTFKLKFFVKNPIYTFTSRIVVFNWNIYWQKTIAGVEKLGEKVSRFNNAKQNEKKVYAHCRCFTFIVLSLRQLPLPPPKSLPGAGHGMPLAPLLLANARRGELPVSSSVPAITAAPRKKPQAASRSSVSQQDDTYNVDRDEQRPRPQPRAKPRHKVSVLWLASTSKHRLRTRRICMYLLSKKIW